MKRIILKYYFVCLLGHKNSKYAYQFSHYWYHAFLQVCVTFILTLAFFALFIEHLLSIEVFLIHSRISTAIFSVISCVLVYLLIFKYYKINKDEYDPTVYGIVITKRTKMIAWVCFILPFVTILGLFWIVDYFNL